MSRSTAFQFRSGNSFFHRLDPLTKFAWLLATPCSLRAYIAWVQIDHDRRALHRLHAGAGCRCAWCSEQPGCLAWPA